MTRFAALIAVIALAAAPAVASTYSAKPLSAPSHNRIVGKDISWSCNGGTCQGSTETSRPLIICQDLARRTGRLESFAADGHALSAAELDKCNSRAGGPTALAHAN